jgi:hypothetical protein
MAEKTAASDETEFPVAGFQHTLLVNNLIFQSLADKMLGL